MSTIEQPIAIDEIKAAHALFAKLIQSYEAQTIKPQFPVTVECPALNPGERWLGVIISADGTKREHIILLPGEKSNISWEDAKAWATSIGGELPDRTEGALLFASMRDEFKQEAYWLREVHSGDSAYAWCQHFLYGGQHSGLKSYHLRARAVRRLVI